MTRVKWAFRDRLTGWAFQRFSIYVAPFVIVLGSVAVMLWAPRQFWRAHTQVSRFPWVCRTAGAVDFILTCRQAAPAAAANARCALLVNDTRVAEVAPAEDWSSFRFTAPASLARPGVNWLEIHWPPEPAGAEEALEWAASELEQGRRFTLLPVFGEIHSLAAVQPSEVAGQGDRARGVD